MLITKADPVGIDIPCQQLQTLLYNKLTALWATTAYNAYGRVYKNKTESGYTAHVFTGDATTGSKDYSQVYWDDTVDVVSFIHIADKVENDLGNTKTTAAVIFFVNLNNLKPEVTHRADEEVRRDVINVLGSGAYGFKYLGYETAIDNVLREYPGTRSSKTIKAVDMHPVHCFRINLNLIYNNFCSPPKF